MSPSVRRADLLVLALSLAVVALGSWPAAFAVPPPSPADVARPLLPEPRR